MEKHGALAFAEKTGVAVTLDFGQVVSVVAGVAGFFVAVWALIRYVHDIVRRAEDRASSDLKKLDERTLADTGMVHRRIDLVKDDYVRRHDYERDIAKIHEDIMALRGEVKEVGSGITSRMDSILTILSSRPPSVMMPPGGS